MVMVWNIFKSTSSSFNLFDWSQNDVRLYDDIVLSEGPIRFVRLAKWRKKLVTHNVQNLAGDFQAFDMELEW